MKSTFRVKRHYLSFWAPFSGYILRTQKESVSQVYLFTSSCVFSCGENSSALAYLTVSFVCQVCVALNTHFFLFLPCPLTCPFQDMFFAEEKVHPSSLILSMNLLSKLFLLFFFVFSIYQSEETTWSTTVSLVAHFGASCEMKSIETWQDSIVE